MTLRAGPRLRSFVASVRHVARRLYRRNSPWQRVTMAVPVGAFGPGSRLNFDRYFDGESSVHVESIDEIVEWLGHCDYVSDADLFKEPDLWQHPGSFEQLRRGDCEDFSLWAWRKLAEIGIEAEFYVGRVLWGEQPGPDRQHSWVVYRADGTDFLFEPAAGIRQRMIRPLSDVMGEYIPHFAIDRHLVTFAFAGCVLDSPKGKRHGHAGSHSAAP